MDKEKQFTITIKPSGFAPAWGKNSWNSEGNKSQASNMLNINLLDPNVMTQGPEAVNLTNGSETGAVTTLISSILLAVVSDDITYATGGDKVYQISSTTVTNDATYPMTIDKASVTGETADDLVYYKSDLYVFYNHSGDAGDIAQVDLSAGTIDADWGSTIPTGAATLQNAPHYAINGGDDVVYFTNGRYIGTIDGTTLDVQALDFWENSQVVSLTWNQNRVLAGVNRPNVTGSNFNQSAIYRWNGNSSSWEGDPIEVNGRIGALYTKNGVTFVWHQDSTDSDGYSLSYINGAILSPISRYVGSLPNQTQVGEHKGYLMWVSNNKVFLFGSSDAQLSVKMFQYMSPKLATTGAIAATFGDLLIASYSGTNYSLAKESGFTTNANWKSKVFPMSSANEIFQIDNITVWTEQMSTGARADFTLRYDNNKSNLSLDSIIYSSDNNTRHKILSKGVQVEDFRIDIDFSNGSTSNPVKIRQIQVAGHYIVNN